ncbi:MAG: lamin tail domain-containing protein, partial [Bacteroidetes bacterium]|nr:lamin tail domain-containing protein [Bacteroidota bacterium]
MLSLPRHSVASGIFLGISLVLAIASNGQMIRLNEVMLLNASTIYDEDGDSENWLEIYNSGPTSANLSGCGLSDDLDDPFKWTFPYYIIPPHNFALIWGSGKDRVDPSEPLHLNFSLDNDEGVIFLTSSQGVILDLLVTIESPIDISFGRLPDGGNEVGLLDP